MDLASLLESTSPGTSTIVKAERWQALSTTVDGKTFYESREVFAGFGAYLIKWFISTPLMQSFEAMADAIQTRAEAQ